MSPVEELRSAAALLRDAATGDMPPGPWQMHKPVGLALADALDLAAEDFGNGTSEEFQRLMLEAGEHGHPEHPLLVAARLILGGGS